MDFENIFQQYINNNGFNEEKHHRFFLNPILIENDGLFRYYRNKVKKRNIDIEIKWKNINILNRKNYNVVFITLKMLVYPKFHEKKNRKR